MTLCEVGVSDTDCARLVSVTLCEVSVMQTVQGGCQ